VVVRHFTQLIVDTEAQQRTMLRLSLEPTASSRPLLLRQGRAIGWLEDALAPLHGTLSRTEVRRLVLAVRATTGIEALVWLTDVAGLSRNEALTLMRWSAAGLLRSAVEGRASARRRRASSR
jgi:hypothetical protein